MKNNNYFPLSGLVETHQSKQDTIQKLEREIEVDEGILELVNVVNEIPLFLSSSSCEGQNGNPSSPHWRFTYIGIGVLYNQIQLIEDLALRLKSVFKNRVNCVLQYEVTGSLIDDSNSEEELLVFRTFLRVEMDDRGILPEVTSFIQQFSETMPKLEAILDKYEAIKTDEINKCRAVEQLIKKGNSCTDYFDDIDYMERIRNQLQRSPFLNVDVHSSLVIKFEIPMDILVEDLYRLLTAATKGQIVAFCTLNIDANNQLVRQLLIDLNNSDHYHLVSYILNLFIDSEHGKML